MTQPACPTRTALLAAAAAILVVPAFGALRFPSAPPETNLHVHVTFVTWTPSPNFTVAGVGAALLY